MGVSAVREVIVVPFPFSDLSQTKNRPTVCLAPVERNEWMVCAVTSTGQGDPQAVSLLAEDFESGSLRHHSFARPLKVFTVHESRIVRKVGKLKIAKFNQIIERLVDALKS